MLNRLKNDFQLSIISLMGLFGVLGITPYAVYRLSEHNWVVGIADCVIVLSTLLAVAHAWRTGDTVKPGLWVSVIFSIAATVITIKLGVNGLFWIYPLILFNFFMVTPGKALVTMIGVLSALVGYASLNAGTVFESHYQMVSFLVTTAWPAYSPLFLPTVRATSAINCNDLQVRTHSLARVIAGP